MKQTRTQRLNGNARPLFVFSVALLLVPVLGGCVGWRSHIDPNALRYDDLIDQGESQPVLKAIVTVDATHEAVDTTVQQERTEDHQEAALKVFRESGLFAEVNAVLPEPDIDISCTVREVENFSQVMAFLCGFTLLLVPAKDRVEATCTARVVAANGEELATLESEGELSVVIQILLFPLIPTANVAASRLEYDLYRSIAVQLKEKGILDRAVEIKAEMSK